MCGKRVGVVIPAAGSGQRFGGDKILYPIYGRPLLYYTVRAFEMACTCHEIVLVVRKSILSPVRTLISNAGFSKVVDVVSGGKTRGESVRKGIEALSPGIGFFSIHDGARPLIQPEQIDQIHRMALEFGAVCAGHPLYDTVQLVDEEQKICSTPDRSQLMCALTPQVFSREIYEDALQKTRGREFSDDAGMVCAAGYSVRMAVCARSNLKVTEPDDITFAEMFLAGNKERN